MELARTQRFEVTERSRRDEILKEQAFQNSGVCDETKCLAKIGKLLGVQKMVGGSVGRLGKTYTVSLRMVDVETGTIDQTAVKDYPGSVDYLLTTAMKDVAWQLARGGLSLKEQRELKRKQAEEARLEAKRAKEKVQKRKEQERIDAKRKAEEERIAIIRAPIIAESLKVEAQKKQVSDSLAAIWGAEEQRRNEEAIRQANIENEIKLNTLKHSSTIKRIWGSVFVICGIGLDAGVLIPAFANPSSGQNTSYQNVGLVLGLTSIPMYIIGGNLLNSSNRDNQRIDQLKSNALVPPHNFQLGMNKRLGPCFSYVIKF